MPCWFYDKKALFSTPSIQDGIDHETECKYRREGAQLIIQIGSQMELGYNTLATGIVYYHRFYMFHSFKTFSPYITACCCLFLAGKAEETPKKSKDIIKIAKKFLTEDKLLSLGDDPREEVMTIEKILLQTLKFDLKVSHPYSFLLKYAKCLKGDKRKLQKMVQMAWTFINDSLCTTLSIQWEPEIIAIAVMYLAGKLVRFKIDGWSHRKPSHIYWWEIFVEDLSLQVVEDICHQVLDLYSPLSRYQMSDSPKPPIQEPNISINSQLDSLTFNVNIAIRDPRFENVTSSVIATPGGTLKDPRLGSGSIFAKRNFDVSTSSTPVLLTTSNDLPGNITFTRSPATPTAPQSMDSLAAAGQLMFKRSFNNVDDSLSIESQGFAINNNCNDYTDSHLMGQESFGSTNKDIRDYSRSQIDQSFGIIKNKNGDYTENRTTNNRGFGNYRRNNHSRYGLNRFKRQNFENNNDGNADDHIGNRLIRTRGFGNINNNNNISNENKPMGNRGFGNRHSNDIQKFNENRTIGNRNFGNVNSDNSRCYDTKPLGNHGFGNADNNDNNCNKNDSRPRIRYNRGNRFQRSEVYPRSFNNNYENNRYSSEDFTSDAPGKIVDKQRFYQASNINSNEEESWD